MLGNALRRKYLNINRIKIYGEELQDETDLSADVWGGKKSFYVLRSYAETNIIFMWTVRM